jgi:hypothetical protein
MIFFKIFLMLSSMSSCYHPVMMMCVFPEKRGHQYFSRGRRIRCNLSHGAIVQTRHRSRWILIERPDLIDRSFLKKKPAALPQFSPKSLPPSPASWMPTCGYGRGGAGLAGGRGHVTSRRAFIESRTQDLPLTKRVL